MGPRLRFDRGARYGAAVVTQLFATYLAITTDFTAIIQAESYTGSISTDVPLLNVLQFIVILAAFTAALAMLPTPIAGRIGGITLALVVLLLWAALGIERGVGAIVHPVTLWSFVLNQGFVTLLASVGGWLIARGRHPLTWVVAIVAVVPSITAMAIASVDLPLGAYALIMEAAVVVPGLAAVWIAARWDRALAARPVGQTDAASADGAAVSAAAD